MGVFCENPTIILGTLGQKNENSEILVTYWLLGLICVLWVLVFYRCFNAETFVILFLTKYQTTGVYFNACLNCCLKF